LNDDMEHGNVTCGQCKEHVADYTCNSCGTQLCENCSADATDCAACLSLICWNCTEKNKHACPGY
jgi:hypothetical protein